ncbi:hypothetical protein BDP67DRAFT_561502 [Colletotrichum lupini]|nr:hypothetical protein BDP67DRAFT_561502 [Colletotrichum lupini]
MSSVESERSVPAPDKPVEEQRPLWKDDDVPAEDSDAFKSRIHPNWSDPPNPKCYASFGDDGVIATVNAYGDLMQFSSFLGVGQSGVFSADYGDTDELFYVLSRAE